MQQLIKTVVVAALILIVGAVLRSVRVIQDTDVWYWSLSDLVAFAMFTAAAVMAGGFAAQLPMRKSVLVLRSTALAPLIQGVVAALIVWLIYLAAAPVVLPDWDGILNAVFAVAMVVVAGWLVWRVYTGFDAIAAEFKHARQAAAPAAPVAAPPPPAAPTVPTAAPMVCPRCGATVPAEKKFCGDCGAAIRG